MRYRSRTDIIGMVLQAAGRKEGATKTRLMYSAFLSYAQVKEYTDYLMEKGLVMLDRDTQLYRLTHKGLEFLNLYDRMNELINSERGEELKAVTFDSTE